jgi:cobalt-zinc-cadmium resistance protein CzcA
LHLGSAKNEALYADTVMCTIKSRMCHPSPVHVLRPSRACVSCGEHSQFVAAKEQLKVIGPLAVLVIFLILFALYGNFQISVQDCFGRGHDGAGGRTHCTKVDGHSVQCFVGSRIAGADGGIGRDRGNSGIVHQQTSAGRQEHSRSHARSFAAALAIDHDDSFGGIPGAFAGGNVTQHRLGYAATICNCDCRGVDVTSVTGLFVNPVLYELVARQDDVLQV